MTEPTIRVQAPGPRSEFPDRSFFLYGDPKVGKTTTLAQFPKVLILSVLSENGTSEIAGEVSDIGSVEALKQVVDWLAADRNGECRGYRAVGLDGLSTLIMDIVVKQKTRDTRKAVKDASAIVLPALHSFLALPCIRVITGHARRDTEEYMDAENKRQTKVSVYPDLPPRIRLFVESRVDAFGYCYPNSTTSKVWWTPLDTEKPKPRAIAAGNRLGLPRTTVLSFAAINAALVMAPPAAAMPASSDATAPRLPTPQPTPPPAGDEIRGGKPPSVAASDKTAPAAPRPAFPTGTAEEINRLFRAIIPAEPAAETSEPPDNF